MKLTASEFLTACSLPARAPLATRRFQGKTRISGLFFLMFVLCLVAMTTPAAFAQSGTPPMTVGTPTVDANGVKYYPVSSVYQGSHQQIIRVLQPTNPAP